MLLSKHNAYSGLLTVISNSKGKQRQTQHDKQYHTVGIIPKSNIKTVARGKTDTLTHKYIKVNFPGLAQSLQ
jgi:hypothetical protein